MNKFYSGKKVIVTGGAGFIGSHLVERLLEAGADVHVMDDYSRGTNTMRGVRYSKLDLRYQEPTFCRDDIVFHLAAKVTGIHYNTSHHLDMCNTNLAITNNVVNAVARCKPALYVYVSTACVYPHDAPVPTPEGCAYACDPEPTNHGYGVAKWVGEQQARYIYSQHNVPTLVVRFFNAFGVRDYYDEETSHVAPALIKRVMSGDNPVVVWGTGDQTRALVDVRDIAECLVALGAVKEAHNAYPVNIGHSRETSVKRLAETIVGLSGRDNVDIVFDNTKPNGYPRRAADVTRLKLLIGDVPQTPLAVTLMDMISDYKKRYMDGEQCA